MAQTLGGTPKTPGGHAAIPGARRAKAWQRHGPADRGSRAPAAGYFCMPSSLRSDSTMDWREAGASGGMLLFGI